MDESERIEFLIRRDGREAARAWVERTLGIYREALATSPHAGSAAYRPLFERSIRQMEEWLAAEQGAPPPATR